MTGAAPARRALRTAHRLCGSRRRDPDAGPKVVRLLDRLRDTNDRGVREKEGFAHLQMEANVAVNVSLRGSVNAPCC
jgi:hypothetical protein